MVDYFTVTVTAVGGAGAVAPVPPPLPPQALLPSYRAFAGKVPMLGLPSGPNAGQAQLPKNPGFDE